MAESNPAAEARARAYLRRQLERNPWDEADQIIATRSRALKLSMPTPQARPAADLAGRQQASQEIDAIRAVCFTEPVEVLTSRLDGLRLEGYPDLAAAAARLRTVLASRHKLPTLVGMKGFDSDFLSCFKQVLTSPARETAVLRERVIVSFTKSKLRKRGQRMIALLQRETPELAALEGDWFATLKNQRAAPMVGLFEQASPRESTERGALGKWAILWILFGAIASMVGRFIAEEDKPKPPSRVSSFSVAPPQFDSGSVEPFPQLNPDASGRVESTFERHNRMHAELRERIERLQERSPFPNAPNARPALPNGIPSPHSVAPRFGAPSPPSGPSPLGPTPGPGRF